MFYVVTYADKSFELQNSDAMLVKDDGSYSAMEYGGAGQWTPEREWTPGEIIGVVEFAGPVAAEAELVNRGGEWSSAKQGPFPQ